MSNQLDSSGNIASKALTRGIMLGALLATAAWGQPPQSAPDPLQAAQTMMAAGNYAAAVSALKPALADGSAPPAAWMLLGQAQAALGLTDAAADTYRHAASIPQLNPRATRALFLLYADAKRDDDAWTWYQQARATGRIDFSGLATSSEIQNLKQDARFNALFPAPGAFEPPFAEHVRIIHEWRGERAGDEFGWEARDIGDVDGDHVDDVVISAPAHPPYGDGGGHVYVYSGKSGKLLWQVDAKPYALLGTSIEAAGDVNRDGVPDVVTGAPLLNTAYVYAGRDGHQLSKITGEKDSLGFGSQVAGVGDINADGYADLLVGAPGSPNPAKPSPADYTGKAYVISGKDGSVLLQLKGEHGGDAFGSAVAGYGGRFLVVGAPGAGPRHTGRVYVYDRLSHKPRFIIDSDATGSALGGMFVSVIGDVDHDGTPDIYASDWSNTAHGPATGRVYVYSGATGKPLLTLTGTHAGEGFGTCAAVTGDVDGDGHADLVIGSWQDHSAAWSGGRVAVYSGKDGHLLRGYTGQVAGETLGFDAVGIGDVDGDGHTDYLLTSAYSLVNGVRSGRVYIVAGG
ncbi:MAG: FG-GAP-like repeat-containing protein [Gammaproteobacteria bacterium]